MGGIPAIVTAGDLGAARAVRGQSKVYLPMGGRSLVQRVVEALQRVPEVDDVWVVGNEERLRSIFESEAVRALLRKPIHIVSQFRSLYENGWETYRRLLPGAPPEGRDPGPDDAGVQVLFVSGDLPLATPQEISAFVRQSQELGCDYGLGLVTEESMTGFLPAGPDKPGIRPAYFNLREGRFRQSNLHLIRPARIRNRHYIQEMYVHRYQKEWGNIASLALRLFRSEQGGFAVLWYYALMHLAGIAHRRGWVALSNFVRRAIPMARIERGITGLLGADFRFVITHGGGCALDIDNEAEYEACQQRLEDWERFQRDRAHTLYGPGTP